MKALVVDLTHGGVKIAISLKKLSEFEEIYCWDIYKTLKEEEKNSLQSQNIQLLKDFKNVKEIVKQFQYSNDFFIIAPIHSPLTPQEIRNNSYYDKKNNISENSVLTEQKYEKFNLTHHEAVDLILNQWKSEIRKKNIPNIEVTGVKGKTSTVSMLKDILIDFNPLILSSLGIYLYKNQKEKLLKENISITPANILEAINLAENNFKLKKNKFNKKSRDFINESNFNYESCIFESSLGATGIGDIGILTNIVENYPIAKNTSNAKEAKKQIFNCDIVVAELETLNKYYKEEFSTSKNRINSFSLKNSENDEIHLNLTIEAIDYDLNLTKLKINYKNIKTIFNNELKGSMVIETFAPGKHHVQNVLGVITAALTLEIDENIIINGLKNFKGIKGRTSRKNVNKSQIIEEINPGINVKAIESSINMINDLNNYYIIIGGKYGITCEEINEDDVALLLKRYMNEKNINLILTDELGLGIKNKMKNDVFYVNDPFEAQKIAIDSKKNILFIYRSNYSQINKR